MGDASSRCPLTVVVRVNGHRPAAWVASCVRFLAESKHIRLAAVLLDDRPTAQRPSDPDSRPRLDGDAPRVITALDRLIALHSTGRMPDPLVATEIDDVLAAFHPVVVDQLSVGGARDCVSAIAPDIVVDLTPPGHPPLSLAAQPRYGVWSYRFHAFGADDLRGVARLETIRRTTLTGFEVITSPAFQQRGSCVAEAVVLTGSVSAMQNRAQTLWSAAPLMSQAIGHFALTGRMRLNSSASDSVPVADDVPEGPRLGAAIALHCGRVFMEACRRTILRDQWVLVADEINQLPDSLHGPRYLLDPGPQRYWADPCVVEHDGSSYVFAEEFPYDTRRGRIVVLDIHRLSSRPTCQVVLDEPWHLSYPFVFSWQGDYYMLPECSETGELRLYRCVTFPKDWRFERTVMTGVRGFDGTLLQHDGRWWLFLAVAHFPWTVSAHELNVYWTDDPVHGNWHAHPHNPVCLDARCSRPGGGFLHAGERLLRVGQDASEGYGSGLCLLEVTQLTDTEYEEHQIAVVRSRWLKGFLGTHTLATSGAHRVMDVRRRISRLQRTHAGSQDRIRSE